MIPKRKQKAIPKFDYEDIVSTSSPSNSLSPTANFDFSYKIIDNGNRKQRRIEYKKLKMKR